MNKNQILAFIDILLHCIIILCCCFCLLTYEPTLFTRKSKHSSCAAGKLQVISFCKTDSVWQDFQIHFIILPIQPPCTANTHCVWCFISNFNSLDHFVGHVKTSTEKKSIENVNTSVVSALHSHTATVAYTSILFCDRTR